MSLTREAKRNIYYFYVETYESGSNAKAVSVGDTIQGGKLTGVSPAMDAAIDFLNLAGDNRPRLDELHLCRPTRAETNRPYTKQDKRICRVFWSKVRARALDEYALFMIERDNC